MKPAFKTIRLIFVVVLLLMIAVDVFYGIAWWIYIVPCLLFLTFIVIGAFRLQRNFFVKAYTLSTSTEKQIALTFDDGPATHSIAVLNALKKHGATATFFCIGSRIEKFPEICRRMAAEGHTIGNHSFSHAHVFPFFSRKRVQKEIERTNELIQGITGKPNRLFRPPFGVTNPTIAAAVQQMDQLVIGWNLRSFDTVSKDPEGLAKRIVEKIKPGTVLLLHDNRPDTAAILDSILQYTARHGYKTVGVESIFGINQDI